MFAWALASSGCEAAGVVGAWEVRFALEVSAEGDTCPENGDGSAMVIVADTPWDLLVIEEVEPEGLLLTSGWSARRLDFGLRLPAEASPPESTLADYEPPLIHSLWEFSTVEEWGSWSGRQELELREQGGALTGLLRSEAEAEVGKGPEQTDWSCQLEQSLEARRVVSTPEDEGL